VPTGEMTREEWLAARSSVVGSSEVAALFDCGYVGPFALWQHKAGNVQLPDIGEEDRIFWGTFLEPAIAAGIARKEGWAIEKAQYVVHPSVPGMGCTPDYYIMEDGKPVAILEVKNVAFDIHKQKWTEGEPPMPIILQAQHQMACTGIQRVYVGALVSGNQHRVYRIDARAGIIREIERRVAAFWQSIREDRPPSPDGSDATYAALLATREEPENDEPADLRGDNEAEAAAADFARGAAMAKEGGVLRDKARNVLIQKCSGFRWAKTNGATVSLAHVPAKPARPAEADEVIPGRAASVRVTVRMEDQ
jgi:predicted phage-related endonuclease